MGQTEAIDDVRELGEKAAVLSESHQAEVLDFVAFLVAKEAEDRADYELEAEAYRTKGKTRTLDAIEAGLDLER